MPRSTGPRAGFDRADTGRAASPWPRCSPRWPTAQASYDRACSTAPGSGAACRRIAAQRTREFRGPAAAAATSRGAAGASTSRPTATRAGDSRRSWPASATSSRLQLRRPVDDAKAAKADMKARAQAVPSTRPRRPRPTSRRRSSNSATTWSRGSRAAGAPGNLAPMGIHDDDVAAVRAASDIVQIVTEYTPLRQRRTAVDGAVPVPLREDAVVLGQPQRERLLLLRVPGQGRRHRLRHGEGGARLPRRGRAAGREGRHQPALHRPHRGRGAQARARYVETMARAVEWYHERLLSGPDAGAARSLPAGTRASAATWCASSGSGGRPTPGTS